MEQDYMKSWLVSMGIPQDRSHIIAEEFAKTIKVSVETLSLDDLDLLTYEITTKLNSA